MDYRLELLSEDNFEALVNALCGTILGTGVISFSKGPDGGKDGCFEGTANNFPSSTSPWSGRFVIQAKHSTSPVATCSENSFHGNQTSLINAEIKKIKDLYDANEIDNYMLFTNRKLSGGTEQEIRKYILDNTQISNVHLVGIETINGFLKANKNIVRSFGLDKFVLPLDFYDEDIKDLIIVFRSTIPKVAAAPPMGIEPIEYIDKKLKNTINNLDEEYYMNRIRQKSLEYFSQIDAFLSDPINIDYALAYQNFADELGNKVEIRRDDFGDFKEVFGFLYDKILNDHEAKLMKHRFLIWVFLHHLYFNCHIGRKS